MASMTGCDEWCYAKRGWARCVHAVNVCPQWPGQLNGSEQRKAPFYDRISSPSLCQDLSFKNVTLVARMAMGYTALTHFDTRVTQWNSFISSWEWHRLPPNQTLRNRVCYWWNNHHLNSRQLAQANLTLAIHCKLTEIGIRYSETLHN